MLGQGITKSRGWAKRVRQVPQFSLPVAYTLTKWSIPHAFNVGTRLKKKGKYYSPNGQTFKDFLNGNLNFLKGERPTLEDFENHLGTIFTELRLKQVIEFRSLDTCNFGCICNGHLSLLD